MCRKAASALSVFQYHSEIEWSVLYFRIIALTDDDKYYFYRTVLLHLYFPETGFL